MEFTGMSKFLLYRTVQDKRIDSNHGTSPRNNLGLGNKKIKQPQQAHRKKIRGSTNLKTNFIETVCYRSID